MSGTFRIVVRLFLSFCEVRFILSPQLITIRIILGRVKLDTFDSIQEHTRCFAVERISQ